MRLTKDSMCGILDIGVSTKRFSYCFHAKFGEQEKSRMTIRFMAYNTEGWCCHNFIKKIRWEAADTGIAN